MLYLQNQIFFNPHLSVCRPCCLQYCLIKINNLFPFTHINFHYFYYLIPKYRMILCKYIYYVEKEKDQ